MSDQSYSPETAELLAQVAEREAWSRRDRARAAALDTTLIETLPDGVVVVDVAGRIVRINAAAERMFGYPREALLGEPVERLVPDAMRAGHPALRGSYAIDPRVRPMGVGREVHGRRQTGEEFVVSITLSQFSTSAGVYVLAVVAPAGG